MTLGPNACTVKDRDVVPKTGAARASWTNPKLPVTGGGMWTSFTLDPGTGILYVPVANPAPDFDIIDRTGSDLLTNSVVALDARTGKLLAYNQLVKRDAHDWDVSTAPALITTRDGKNIIASANKDGLLSVLDRTTRDRSAIVQEFWAVRNGTTQHTVRRRV